MGLLEKKIEELESQLTPLLLAPASALPGSEPTESTGDIPAKIGFLNNLLAREMEINSEDKPESLKHVAGRLAMLEAAFHNWNNHGHGAPSLDDLLNDIPTCSCTHSCLIDEQQEEEEEQEVQAEDGKRMEKEDDDDDVDGEKKGGEVFQKDGSGNREQRRIIGVKCHRLGGVLVVVAAAVFLAAAVNFWVVEEEDFLVPT